MGRLAINMIDFSEVEQSVAQLNRQFLKGELDKSTFRGRLVEIIDLAEDGYYWMIGYQSGLWYRHDGTQWLVDNPDRLLPLLPQQDGLPDFRFADKSRPSSASLNSNHQPTANQANEVDWLWLIVGIVLLGVIIVLVYSSL